MPKISQIPSIFTLLTDLSKIRKLPAMSHVKEKPFATTLPPTTQYGTLSQKSSDHLRAATTVPLKSADSYFSYAYVDKLVSPSPSIIIWNCMMKGGVTKSGVSNSGFTGFKETVEEYKKRVLDNAAELIDHVNTEPNAAIIALQEGPNNEPNEETFTLFIDALKDGLPPDWQLGLSQADTTKWGVITIFNPTRVKEQSIPEILQNAIV